MKRETKQKRIKYFQGLIDNKQAQLENYLNGSYIASEDWDHKAMKMITNWKAKITQIENLSEERKPYSRKPKSSNSKSYPVSVTEKKCSRCGEIKKAKDFSTNKQVLSGLTSWCKPCMKERRENETVKEEYYKKHGKYDSREEMLRVREENKRTRSERLKKKVLEYRNSWGSGVYLVITDGGNYVGYSKYLRTRRDSHNSKRLRPDSCIAGVYKVLEFQILEVTTDKSREQYWIHKLNPELNTVKFKNKVA